MSLADNMYTAPLYLLLNAEQNKENVICQFGLTIGKLGIGFLPITP